MGLRERTAVFTLSGRQAAAPTGLRQGVGKGGVGGVAGSGRVRTGQLVVSIMCGRCRTALQYGAPSPPHTQSAHPTPPVAAAVMSSPGCRAAKLAGLMSRWMYPASCTARMAPRVLPARALTRGRGGVWPSWRRNSCRLTPSSCWGECVCGRRRRRGEEEGEGGGHTCRLMPSSCVSECVGGEGGGGGREENIHAG